MDVTANYDITYVNGTLSVTANAAAITVTPGSGTKVYDGTALTKTAPEDFTVTGIPEGFTWTATADGTVTNVTPGDGEKAVNAVTSFKIFDAGKNDVTDQFSGIDVSATGTLTVTAKSLTITAASGTKAYDGTALTKDGYTNTDLSSGDAIESVTVTGSQTVVGTSDNVASAAVIKNASNVDVTANYDITYVNGTLSVTTLTVSAPTITLSQTSCFYDGTAKTPTVTVKDGTTIIPATEYTVGYSNNTAIGTATVTITDKDGGNYTVSGSTTFEIILKGDANGDNKVDAADIVKLVKDGASQSDIDAVVKIIMQNK